jgi:CheY-like chemotaxis protein
MPTSSGPPQGERSRKVPATPGVSGAKILVVEDDRVGGALIERYLVGAGHHVVLAGDGAEALIQLGSASFDLTLSDINMPNLDGLKLVEIMIQKGLDTPVVLLTADGVADPEAKGLELGVDDVLTKPIKKDVLLLIGRILERRRKDRP